MEIDYDLSGQLISQIQIYRYTAIYWFIFAFSFMSNVTWHEFVNTVDAIWIPAPSCMQAFLFGVKSILLWCRCSVAQIENEMRKTHPLFKKPFLFNCSATPLFPSSTIQKKRFLQGKAVNQEFYLKRTPHFGIITLKDIYDHNSRQQHTMNRFEHKIEHNFFTKKYNSEVMYQPENCYLSLGGNTNYMETLN